ncbi:MAG: CHASE2 domain-containing protein [Acidobacteria bacterium]|nr:CHASE2 domain-containing protein [Acidobacteriota bacterium]
MKRLKSLLPILFSLALLAGGVSLRIADPALVQTLRLGVYDSFQRIKPRVYEPTPVRIIDLDDETLARMGQWPWPRTLVAELVQRLTDLGAAVIVFDIVFAEPDRTSPQAVLPLWPDIPEVEALRQAAAKLPSHDEILAETIAKSRVVTGFVLDRSGKGRTPVLKKSYVFGGEDPLRWATRFTGAVTTLAELEDAAAGNGWTWVGGVASTYSQGHGYCAPWPNYGYPDEFEDAPLLFRRRLNFPEGWYRPPGHYRSSPLLNQGPVSWYRTAGQSAALQGPSPRFLTSGTLHPNELGHGVIALLALTAIAAGD